MVTNMIDLKNNIKDVRDNINILLKKTTELPNLMKSNPIVSQIKKDEIKLLQNRIEIIGSSTNILLEKATNISTNAAKEFTDLSRIINNYMMDDIINSLKKNFENLNDVITINIEANDMKNNIINITKDVDNMSILLCKLPDAMNSIIDAVLLPMLSLSPTHLQQL